MPTDFSWSGWVHARVRGPQRIIWDNWEGTALLQVSLIIQRLTRASSTRRGKSSKWGFFPATRLGHFVKSLGDQLVLFCLVCPTSRTPPRLQANQGKWSPYNIPLDKASKMTHSSIRIKGPYKVTWQNIGIEEITSIINLPHKVFMPYYLFSTTWFPIKWYTGMVSCPKPVIPLQFLETSLTNSSASTTS